MPGGTRGSRAGPRRQRYRTAGRAALSLVALAPVLGGCFRYAEAPAGGVTPGAHVRASLTPEESARVGDVTGREARVVEGVVVAPSAAGDLTVSLPLAAEPSRRLRSLRTAVRVPAAGIERLEVRRLDRSRTGWLVAIGGVVAGLLVSELATSAGDAPDPEAPDPNAVRIPVGVRLRF